MLELNSEFTNRNGYSYSIKAIQSQAFRPVIFWVVPENNEGEWVKPEGILYGHTGLKAELERIEQSIHESSRAVERKGKETK